MYGTTHELVIYWRSKPQPRFYVISGPQASLQKGLTLETSAFRLRFRRPIYVIQLGL